MKFKIRDESGTEFNVEEIEDNDNDIVEKNEPLTDKCELSPDEISALKRLASIADKLAGLVTTTDEDEEIEVDVKEVENEDGDEQIEEVIDTAKKNTNDSIKRSATSIEKRVKTEDSLEEDKVSTAWAKRYGGKR